MGGLRPNSRTRTEVNGKPADRVVIEQPIGLPVDATLIDADGDQIDITECGEIRNDESAFKEAQTSIITLTGNAERLANIDPTGAVDMVDRKTVFIQPINGDIYVGFSHTGTPNFGAFISHHLVTEGNYFEAKFRSPIKIYLRRKGNGARQVAITEAK